MSKVVGRLAPSPTGALHLGNARTFLVAWLSVRQQQGTVILRIEDLDSPRIKPAARASTVDDLRWLGLDWDFGPDLGGPQQPYTQTDRAEIYVEKLKFLIDQNWVYPCTCSRSEIARSASAPHESVEGPVYPGTCRARPATDARHLPADDFAWRWRATDTTLTFTDAVHSPLSKNVARDLGDFLVARGTGWPAYQLAVVVDDYLMGVTEVVRGDDLLASTLRQLDLLNRLGWPIPAYAHVPLIVGVDHRRLAKRHGDTRLSYFREQGIQPQTIIGYLAWTLGMQPTPQPIEVHELIGKVQWQKIPKGATVFNLSENLPIMKRMQ